MAGFFDETYTVGLFIIVGFLVGVAVGPPIVQGLKRGSKRATQILLKTPTHELVGGIIGLVSGWVVALIISIPLLRIPYLGDYVPVILGVVLGYFGLMVGLRKTDDLPDVLSRTGAKGMRSKTAATQGSPKILDTSVIIDGRISDIT